jgi:hypothetical protein
LIQFGLRDTGVSQAGSTATNAGHRHLFVDVTEPIAEKQNHLHFGAGQTETTLDLPPRRHTLQLVLGDAEHRRFVPLLASQKITINVVTHLPTRSST